MNTIIKRKFIISRVLINNGYKLIPSRIYDVCEICIIKNDIEFFKFISDNYHHLIDDKLLLKSVLKVCIDYNNLEFIKFIFQNYLIDLKISNDIRKTCKNLGNKYKNISEYLNKLII